RHLNRSGGCRLGADGLGRPRIDLTSPGEAAAVRDDVLPPPGRPEASAVETPPGSDRAARRRRGRSTRRAGSRAGSRPGPVPRWGPAAGPPPLGRTPPPPPPLGEARVATR